MKKNSTLQSFQKIDSLVSLVYSKTEVLLVKVASRIIYKMLILKAIGMFQKKKRKEKSFLFFEIEYYLISHQSLVCKLSGPCEDKTLA